MEKVAVPNPDPYGRYGVSMPTTTTTTPFANRSTNQHYLVAPEQLGFITRSQPWLGNTPASVGT